MVFEALARGDLEGAPSGEIDWVWIVVPILVVLSFHLSGSLSLLFTRLRRDASSPLPLDFASFPGINHAFLEKWSVRLKELGFRHLLDFELPHLGNERTRLISSSYTSPDGKTLGTLWQRFASSFAHDYYSFTTWFRSGHRLITTTNPMPVPDINPYLHHQRFPDSQDMNDVLKRHEAALAARPDSWGEAERVSQVEDLDRVFREGWSKEIDCLSKRGLFKVEGEHVRATVYGAGTFFWKGIRPLPANYAPAVQLVRIGVPSVLAFASAYAVSFLFPTSEHLLLWAMAAVGAVFGFALWYHAFFWCLAVPSSAAFLATHRPDLSARSAVYAVCGLVVGFIISAARSQGRGRKVMELPPPAGRPPAKKSLFRSVVVVVVAAAIVSALFDARVKNLFSVRDRVAEAAFQRIEQTLSGARTLTVRFEREAVFPRNKIRMAGTLMLKEGNRMVLKWKTFENEGQESSGEALLVSNGSEQAMIVWRKDGQKETPFTNHAPGQDVNAKASILLTRSTVTSGLQVLVSSLEELQEAYRVSQLRRGKTNGTAGVLTYHVGFKDAALTYDPVTFLPRKRVLTDPQVIVGKSTFTETYLEWTLNAEIPDEAFELPKEK